MSPYPWGRNSTEAGEMILSVLRWIGVVILFLVMYFFTIIAVLVELPSEIKRLWAKYHD